MKAKYCLGLLLLFAAPLAVADDLAVIKQVVNTVFDTTSGLAANSPYLDDGKRLYRYILLILLSWNGIQLVFDNGGINAAIARLVKIILMAGIATTFMSTDVQQALVKGFDAAAAKAVISTHAGVNMTDPAQGILSIVGTGMSSVHKLWVGSDPSASDDKGVMAKTRAWLLDLITSSPLDLLGSLITETIAKLLMSLVMMAAIAMYAVMLLMSQVLVNIGLILAPLFVPWLMWEGTAFLFHGWLKFIITTGTQKIVGALLFGMTIQMMDAIRAVSDTAAASPTFNFFAYSIALIMVLMMAYLILQIPAIANGLVSGMPSTDASNFIPKAGGGGGRPAPSRPSGGPKPPPPSNRVPPKFSKPGG